MRVIFGNKEIELKGTQLNIGDHAEDFIAIDPNFKEKRLSDFTDDIIVLSVVPSLDTGTCDRQTRVFNERLNDMKKVTLITISNDLPFAQKRWCGNAGLQQAITLSDHKYLDFANKYGTLMEELRLQARTVFVLDKDRTVVYKEVVQQTSELPDFDEVLHAVKELR